MAKSDQLTFRVTPELRAALDNYLQSHRFPPPMGDVLTKALEDFLKAEGFGLPPTPPVPPAAPAPASPRRRRAK